MPDYSKMSDQDLQAAYAQSAQAASPSQDYSKMSDEELKSAYSSASQPQQSQSTMQAIGSQVMDTGRAISNGVWNGMADTDKAIGQGTTGILHFVGLISQDTADKLNQSISENADLLRPGPGSALGIVSPGLNNSLSQSGQNNPITSKAAQYGTDAYMLGGSGSGLGTAGSELAQSAVPSAIKGIAGMVGNAAGMGVANAAAGDPSQQRSNFLTGVAGQAGFDLAGKAVGMIGGNATKVQQLNNILSSYSKDKVNNAFSDLRQMEFAPLDKAKVNTISDNLTNAVKNNITDLSSEQQNLLRNLNGRLQNINSFDKALNVFHDISKKSFSKSFEGVNAPQDVFNAFRGIKSQLEQTITEAASRNGLNEAFNNASNLYRTNQITQKIFGAAEGSKINNPDEFNFKNITKQLNIKINKYDGVPGLEKTVDTLRGMTKITKEIGNSLKIPKYGTGVVGAAVGAALSGGAAKYEGGDTKESLAAGGIGAGLGFFGGPMAMQMLNKYGNSPAGQELLRGLTKPGITAQDVRNVIKGITLMGVQSFRQQSSQGQQ